MTVLISINDGFSVSALASSIALEMASKSLPSLTKICCQPYASYRAPTFSVKAFDVGPSKEISFESYKTISLPSFMCPAIELASAETPSIKSPSPHNA